MFGTAMEEVRRNLRNAKVKTDRVTLIPGWYAETLNQKTKERLPLKTAAIVNIDCDVYESTVPVLDFIEAYLADGSVLIFDDWYCFRNKRELGEQKAFREWLERNRHLRATPYKEFGWDGKAFIINRIAGNGPSLPEHEYLFDLVNDSVMMRTMEGRIKLWNRRAEELYGWRKEEAIGRVSHSLLLTQFPKPLEEIDSELVENGRWEGKLVHTTRDGGRVAVESRWALDLKGQSGCVVEINTRSDDFPRWVSAKPIGQKILNVLLVLMADPSSELACTVPVC
jgi:PAS domain S-box-containing protein